MERPPTKAESTPLAADSRRRAPPVPNASSSSPTFQRLFAPPMLLGYPVYKSSSTASSVSRRIRSEHLARVTIPPPSTPAYTRQRPHHHPPPAESPLPPRRNGDQRVQPTAIKLEGQTGAAELRPQLSSQPGTAHRGENPQLLRQPNKSENRPKSAPPPSHSCRRHQTPQYERRASATRPISTGGLAPSTMRGSTPNYGTLTPHPLRHRPPPYARALVLSPIGRGAWNGGEGKEEGRNSAWTEKTTKANANGWNSTTHVSNPWLPPSSST